MVENIDEASFQEDIRMGIKRSSALDPKKLEQERYEVATQFRVLFSEELLFDSFIDNIDKESVLSPMIDYLIDIEDEQWDILLQQVLKAQISTSYTEISSGHAGSHPDKHITFIKLPNRQNFRRVTSLRDNTTVFEVVDTSPEWRDNDEIEIQSNTPVVTTTNDMTDQSTGLVEDTAVLPLSRPTTFPTAAVISDTTSGVAESKKAPAWETEIRRAVGETLTKFENTGLVFEGDLDARRIGRISPSTKMATKEAILRLESNGRKAVKKPSTNPHDWSFDLPSVVLMDIQNSWSNVFDSTQRRKRANKIIDECVESYMTARHERLSLSQ